MESGVCRGIYFDRSIGHGWHSPRHRRRMKPAVSPRSTAPVKYRMTFWRAFNRLNWKWLPRRRYIREATSIPWKRLYERTDVRDERYIIFFLPSLSLPPPLFPFFSHFHTSPQLFLLPFFSLSHFLPFSSFAETVFLVSPPFTSLESSPNATSISLPWIFAHSLMRHIASCAGGNDDDEDWTPVTRITAEPEGRRRRRRRRVA